MPLAVAGREPGLNQGAREGPAWTSRTLCLSLRLPLASVRVRALLRPPVGPSEISGACCGAVGLCGHPESRREKPRGREPEGEGPRDGGRGTPSAGATPGRARCPGPRHACRLAPGPGLCSRPSRLSSHRYFFASVVSAAAGLLCMVATLLYIFTQYFINPAGLRTDPHYRSISDQNTWLLLLPLFPVRTSTPVFLGIGALTLLLELVSLLLLGHLLLLHLYLRAKKLSTFEYIMQNNKLQRSKTPAVKRDVTPPRKGFLQLDNYLRSPAQGSKKPKEFLPTSMHLSLCSATVKPEDTSSSTQPVASLSSSVQSMKLTEQDSTINIPGESSSGLQELDANLSSSTVGVKWRKFLPPLSRCPSVTSLRTIRPESSLKLEDAKDRRDVRQHTEGDVAENQGSASGAQGPAPTESPLQGSFSASRLPVESVPETHDLLSSLRGQRKDTWSQKHWDVFPSSQKPWSSESTAINTSESCQEVPHVWAMAPHTQVLKGLPVIEEEEYGMKVTPVVSVEEGCSPEEATEPGSSAKVTMIIVSEDPEPEDRAAQPE
ncbi:uncharacterized protein LOC101277516 isoform X1 [Orcinus orca]|uniref:uncharacterized protein LOC101277516 isoform X1 n=1 Tax=Orcinus orca TaxID=9733 RepID=UPI0021134AC0|nr:uncharacterized protein LOC101277516 isoform X1 [Orcinus orca]